MIGAPIRSAAARLRGESPRFLPGRAGPRQPPAVIVARCAQPCSRTSRMRVPAQRTDVVRVRPGQDHGASATLGRCEKRAATHEAARDCESPVGPRRRAAGGLAAGPGARRRGRLLGPDRPSFCRTLNFVSSEIHGDPSGGHIGPGNGSGGTASCGTRYHTPRSPVQHVSLRTSTRAAGQGGGCSASQVGVRTSRDSLTYRKLSSYTSSWYLSRSRKS